MKHLIRQKNRGLSRDHSLYRRIFTLLIFAAVPILSCRSDGSILKYESLSDFYLMAKVFNGENRSCPGVLVTLRDSRGKIHEAQTDITGKALFPPIPFGSYYVILRKEGHEQAEFHFIYNRPDQALYGRLYSYEHILGLCINHMERQEWDQAQNWLDRAVLLRKNEQLTLFYHSIILWKTGFPREAADKLEEAGQGRGTMAPAMAQFLSDLYEYDLKEDESEDT